MKPVPVAFHIGPLEVHTYGIGLAITFCFAYLYFGRRLRHNGYRTDWMAGMFVWVIVAAIVGARAMSVLSNLGYYSHNPGEIIAVWHGGLSSFGGLILAVPTGIILTRRRCPELATMRGLDLVAPVLAAAWAMGRLLGPQLMVRGGGHPTSQWFGMYYATQVGKRLPVPIFQAFEDFAIFVVLILLERRLEHWPDGARRVGYPAGAVLGTGMVLWGIERAADQRLWLAYPNDLGSELVQVAGVALAVGGVVVLVTARRRWRAWLSAGAPGGRLDPQAPDPGATSGDGAPVLSGESGGLAPATSPGAGADDARREPGP
jgi:phosphatidylglycerol:prolipoprotein diacylglycerol transferase